MQRYDNEAPRGITPADTYIDLYDFAVGASWGAGPAAVDGAAAATTWGGFLVSYFQATQPGGPDDPTPLPLPKADGGAASAGSRVYLPVIAR